MSLSSLFQTSPKREVISARSIAFRTRGQRHGPIIRLMSPHDVGERIKPFIFLDYIDIGIEQMPRFGFHPHSGIATLTLLLEGGFAYEDTTGASGEMAKGAVEWMQAGGGVWHTGHGLGERIKGYQLWIALPPQLENAPPLSQYLVEKDFPRHGPARLVLGDWEGLKSPIVAPSAMVYLEVNLKDGDTWTFTPPLKQTVAWVSVHQGSVRTPDKISAGELAVFEENDRAITFQAAGNTSFILGSAVKHPYDLVSGYYSVHTNSAALAKGEEGIQRIASRLNYEV